MELLKLRDGAFDYYRRYVKGKGGISYEDAQKELTAKACVAKEMPLLEEKPNRLLKYFGNLAMVIENNEIKWLRYYDDRNLALHIDKNTYYSLKKELGLSKEVS